MATTTERETALSAVRNGADPGSEGPSRNARPRARERGTPETAQTAFTERERRGLLARLAADLTPPEPWTHRSPAPAAVYRYATRGGWTGPTGPARRAGVWWARLVAIPVVTLAAYVAWLVARPSRTLTAALIAVVVWMAVR